MKVESWYKHVLVFDISCKTFVCGKPLCIRFDKIYGFINVSDGSKYFALTFHVHVIIFIKPVEE